MVTVFEIFLATMSPHLREGFLNVVGLKVKGIGHDRYKDMEDYLKAFRMANEV